MRAGCVVARFRTRIVDVVAVKGKTIGVSVYEILSRKDDNTNAEVHDLIVAQCETTVLCWKSGAGLTSELAGADTRKGLSAIRRGSSTTRPRSWRGSRCGTPVPNSFDALLINELLLRRASWRRWADRRIWRRRSCWSGASASRRTRRLSRGTASTRSRRRSFRRGRVLNAAARVYLSIAPHSCATAEEN